MENRISQPTIYVIEDDIGMITLYRDLLESIGVPTRFFTCGEDFFRAWSAEWTGGLIVDLRMPGISGLEVLRRLRANGSQLPAIVATGYGEIRTTVQAMKLGAIEFLEKPFSNSELLEAVQAMLAQGRQQALEQSVRAEMEASLNALSAREREVAELIARGLTSREIAQVLAISPRTVDAHRAQALIKTNCSTSIELATLFSRLGELPR